MNNIMLRTEVRTFSLTVFFLLTKSKRVRDRPEIDPLKLLGSCKVGRLSKYDHNANALVLDFSH